jgi:hypothetical protein
MKNRIIQVVILFIGVFAFAQQDPHYTQYMYNMSVMNPAYAGSKENLSMGLYTESNGLRLRMLLQRVRFLGMHQLERM